jgi:hypothetical protein
VTVAALPAPATADPGDDVRIERLGAGMVRVTAPDGSRVVGPEGLTVKVTRATGETGSSGTIQVTMPNDRDAAALAEAYKRAGRSPVADAIAAGVSPALVEKMRVRTAAYQRGRIDPVGIGPAYVYGGPAVIYSSFCVYDNSGAVDWSGCTIRSYDSSDTDPSYSYRIDESQATGHETEWFAWLALERGGIENRYNTNRVTILQISPSSDINVASCTTQGLGFVIAGFGVSVTETLCPDRWDITRDYTSVPRYHKVEWQGDSHDDRSADALTGFKLQDGYDSSMSLWINWQTG